MLTVETFVDPDGSDITAISGSEFTTAECDVLKYHGTRDAVDGVWYFETLVDSAMAIALVGQWGYKINPQESE